MAVDAFEQMHEAFVLYPVYATVAEQVTTSQARDADPQSVFGAAMAADPERLIALLYGHGHGDSIKEAGELLGTVLEMCALGRRPRYGLELGIVI